MIKLTKAQNGGKMFSGKMNKVSHQFGKTLLFLSVAIFMTAVMTNPCMAKQNDALPSDAMGVIAKVISKDLPASYDIDNIAECYAAENRAHGLKIEFSDQEIRFC